MQTPHPDETHIDVPPCSIPTWTPAWTKDTCYVPLFHPHTHSSSSGGIGADTGHQHSCSGRRKVSDARSLLVFPSLKFCSAGTEKVFALARPWLSSGRQSLAHCSRRFLDPALGGHFLVQEPPQTPLKWALPGGCSIFTARSWCSGLGL